MHFVQYLWPKKVALLILLFEWIDIALAQASYNIEPLQNSNASLGEGLHWDVATQSLYYVDTLAAKLLRYDYRENKIYACKIEGEEFASTVIPIKNKPNKFVVGCGRRVVVVGWDGKSESCHVESVLFKVQPEPKFKENRLNEGKCDLRGRLFIGTFKYTGDVLSTRYGELYKYEKGGKVELMKTNVSISNGMAWNEERKIFYYIDSGDYVVREYEYNMEEGSFANPRIVLDLRTQQLVPDSMTIDTEGKIYVALANNGTVVKADPRTGRVLLEIQFPVNQVTAAAWGGPKLDILYVTTGAMFEPPPAGTVYKVTGLGAMGLPSHKMQL